LIAGEAQLAEFMRGERRGAPLAGHHGGGLAIHSQGERAQMRGVLLA
jgi:hypothetical protein